MNKLAGGMATYLLVLGALSAADTTLIYSTPAVPPKAALDRLNLKLAWRTYVPTDGRRDGFFSVLALDNQVLIQLRSGTMLALDTVTGATQWSANFGIPYALSQPLAYNSQ